MASLAALLVLTTGTLLVTSVRAAPYRTALLCSAAAGAVALPVLVATGEHTPGSAAALLVPAGAVVAVQLAGTRPGDPEVPLAVVGIVSVAWAVAATEALGAPVDGAWVLPAATTPLTLLLLRQQRRGWGEAAPNRWWRGSVAVLTLLVLAPLAAQHLPT